MMFALVALAAFLAWIHQKEMAMAVITGPFALMQVPAKKE